VFSAGLAAGNVQPYFLSQADVELDGSLPLGQQPGLEQIQGQALQVAQVFTAFIDAATRQLDIAIYDFRLLAGPPARWPIRSWVR
jgi:hypothetical protein